MSVHKLSTEYKKNILYNTTMKEMDFNLNQGHRKLSLAERGNVSCHHPFPLPLLNISGYLHRI